MKILLTTIIAVCAFTLTVSAQWSTSSPNSFFQYTGSVGIGITSSPLGKLVVKNSNDTLPALFVSNSSANSTGLLVHSGPLSSSATVILAEDLLGNPKFLVRGDGKIGVGTASPGTMFDVSAGSYSLGIRSLNQGALSTVSGGGLLAATPNTPSAAGQRLGAVAFGATNDGSTYKYASVISGFSSAGWSGTQNGSYLTFNTTPGTTATLAERMRIDENGNVGIGNTTPNGRVDVNGSILLNSYTNTTTRPDVGTTHINGEISGYSSTSVASDDGFLRLSAGGGTNSHSKTFIDLSGYSTVSDMNKNIVFGTGGVEHLRIDGSGNVGIGTDSPDQALTVDGQVHSTSVVVTSSVPADYVFANSYYLRPLADVKAFVDKNHHLPEVPSAADFKKDGQNLGAMNMTLLKKVEELTLYLIEKDKEAQKQQAEINQLIKELAELKQSKK